MDVRSRQSVTATQQTVGLPQVKAFGSWRVYLGAGVATGPPHHTEEETMNRYRKVPVEIEAVQFTEEAREQIIEWSDCRHGAIDDDGAEYETANLFFGSYPSERMAQPGDWIVRDIDGEFYPCKPDIFAKAYEPVCSNPEGQ